MKTRMISLLLALVLVLTALPVPARAAAVRLPIYTGVLEADYLAEQILREIPTAGLSTEQEILAVYDWIIEHCERYGWDGTLHFNESDVYAASHGEFAKEYRRMLDAGQILLRRELKDESGTPPGYYDFTGFVMDSSYNVGAYAYEMMLKRVGNCAHYSALFALLLGHLGYDSRMVHGEFINMDGSVAEHTWNYVLIDGKYYWFDIRIDDELLATYQISEHSYFMEGDTEVWAREHNFDPEYSDWLEDNARWIQEDLDLAAANAGTPWDACSDWAREYMRRAGNAGLIPTGLDYQDLTQKITRAEFAAAAVRLYESLTGEAVEVWGESPFTDTDNYDVLRAYGLGVVNGMGDGTFAPDSPLTREQAVTMLGRVYELYLTGTVGTGEDLPQELVLAFRDHNDIFDYAKNYVYFFAGQTIVEGMGDGTFAPKLHMTREQAIKVAGETADRLG